MSRIPATEFASLNWFIEKTYIDYYIVVLNDQLLKQLQCQKKYQVVIPQKLRWQSGAKPSDKMVAVTKQGIIQYIPVRPIKETKGFVKELNTDELSRRHHRKILKYNKSIIKYNSD
jgi:bifunctional DNA-binding transcriptional regulator/antitoxin component of YhaV-PrlF toxin-antitoxin module